MAGVPAVGDRLLGRSGQYLAISLRCRRKRRQRFRDHLPGLRLCHRAAVAGERIGHWPPGACRPRGLLSCRRGSKRSLQCLERRGHARHYLRFRRAVVLHGAVGLDLRLFRARRAGRVQGHRCGHVDGHVRRSDGKSVAAALLARRGQHTDHPHHPARRAGRRRARREADDADPVRRIVADGRLQHVCG